jgi:VWFA-related protein
MNMARQACLAFLLCLPAFSAAQSTAPTAPQVASLSRSPAPTTDAAEGLIKLDVVVTDQAGKPVSGLGPGDMTLLDNGQPVKIVSFHAVGGAMAKLDPADEVILVIDAVNLSSQHQKISEVQQAVEKFLRQNDGHLSQPVEVYKLSDTGLMVTPEASTNGNTLAAELSHNGELRKIGQEQSGNVLTAGSFSRRQPGQSESSSIQPPIWQLSLNALGSIVLEERLKPGRKLLIWVGHGWPVGVSDSSFDSITEFSTRLREARIALYSVASWPNSDRMFHYQNFLNGVKSVGHASTGNLALEVLATQSGGQVVESDQDLADLINRCVEDASVYYTLSFDPPHAEQTDEYRDLKAQVARQGLETRTRTGYYNEPAYRDQTRIATERVTIEQLEQELGTAHSSSDAEVARRLSGIQLTERMSSAQLSSWKDRMPGPKAWAALVALADTSAFLNPPAAEIPATAPPDFAEQRQMLSRTIDYLRTTIPRLPNFFATRTMVRYEEPFEDDQSWKKATGDQTLHMTGSASATVLYRDGAEAVDSETVKGKKSKADDRYLVTKGTFGPFLGMVIQDAARGNLTWGHWEQSTDGPRAVFRYGVPEKESHYEIAHCCLLAGDGTGLFQRMAAYHGEIAIDPTSGAIAHVTLEADMQPNLPVLLSGILVEYGPVEIGGSTYICPVRSISIMRGRPRRLINEWGASLRVYGPPQTMLTDTTFGDYHMFRSEMRILTGDSTPPDQK